MGSAARARPSDSGGEGPPAEAGLVAALRADQPDAKAAFVQRYKQVVERVIARFLGFDAELADYVQEVFAEALTSLDRLRDPAALEPWLSSIAANTARKGLRERARGRWLRRFVDADEEDRYEPTVAGVDVEARRALRGVYAVLAHLSVDERSAFALRFIDGMELTEVAAASRVSLSTIKRRLARAERRFFAKARHQPDLTQWLASAFPKGQCHDMRGAHGHLVGALHLRV